MKSFLPPVNFEISGGGKIGSTAILKLIYKSIKNLIAFSTIFGIKRAKRVELTSKHGLVLTSIK
jgi:hypothetical protein